MCGVGCNCWPQSAQCVCPLIFVAQAQLDAANVKWKAASSASHKAFVKESQSVPAVEKLLSVDHRGYDGTVGRQAKSGGNLTKLGGIVKKLTAKVDRLDDEMKKAVKERETMVEFVRAVFQRLYEGKAWELWPDIPPAKLKELQEAVEPSTPFGAMVSVFLRRSCSTYRSPFPDVLLQFAASVTSVSPTGYRFTAACFPNILPSKSTVHRVSTVAEAATGLTDQSLLRAHQFAKDLGATDADKVGSLANDEMSIKQVRNA